MLKKFTLALSLIMAASIVYDAYNNIAHSNATGAPAGRTGNPGELSGATCNLANCHVGGLTVTDQTFSVSSTVPSNGYEPGQTYTITIEMTNPGDSIFGFEVSPQSNNGSLLGTLSNPSAGAQLIGGGKYVTHTIAGNKGLGSKTWTFDWTAPAMGTGTVTFWSAYNFANGNNAATGDVIVNSTYEVPEASVSINEIGSSKEGFSVYPNPAIDRINISFNITEPENVSIELFSVDGKLVSELAKDYLLNGEHNFNYDVSTINAGIYFVKVSEGKNSHYKKVMIK